MKIARLAGSKVDSAMTRCFEALDPEAPEDYRQLAAMLACDWKASAPSRVGLAGGQGAGKSTLGRLIESACAGVGLRACVLGIDDFYLSDSARRVLAERVHPLLETRGPPGTHDMAQCCEVMEGLVRAAPVDIPVFDKGIDDRAGTRRVRGPFDVVVLEGWCVGAGPEGEAALQVPVNALEAELDPDGTWRRYVNDALAGEYARVWQSLAQLVFLRVPGLEAVRRWRLEQEQTRPRWQRLDAAEIDRFVQHYERLTRAMLATLPERADLTVDLAEDHSIASLSYRVP